MSFGWPVPEVKFTLNAFPGAALRLNRGPIVGWVERTSLDQKNLQIALWNLMLEIELPDHHFELVYAVAEALAGNHTGLKLTAEKLADGHLPRPVYERLARRRATNVADQVDRQVALGIKQEAAVEQAMQDFAVSRREVFRSLKTVRAERLAEIAGLGDDIVYWEPLYPGFEVAADGRLVSTGGNHLAPPSDSLDG